MFASIQYNPAQLNVLPPDFLHGVATIDTVYATYGERWVERALLVVHDGERTFWGAFDDYFFCMGEGAVPDALRARDSVIVLNLDAASRQTGSVTIRCSKLRFRELEAGSLGISRECHDGQTDLLSLVCLCGTLGLEQIH